MAFNVKNRRIESEDAGIEPRTVTTVALEFGSQTLYLLGLISTKY